MSLPKYIQRYNTRTDEQIKNYLEFIRKVKVGREALDEIYDAFHTLKEALGGLGTIVDENGRRIPAPYVPYLLDRYANAINVIKKYKDNEELKEFAQKGIGVLKSKLPYVIEAAKLYEGALTERIEEKTEEERKQIGTTQDKLKEIATNFDELLKELDC